MNVLAKGTNVPVLGHVTLGGVVLGVIVGYVFAAQVRKIPGVNKIPTA